MSGLLAKQYLADYQKKTKPILDKFLSQKVKEAGQIGKSAEDIVKRLIPLAKEGKRFRGALFTLGYQLSGGKLNQKILEASLSIELIHLGFLMQDDVMDQDETRRGLPAFHTQFDNLHLGESMAINASDLAFAYGWERLLKSSFSAEKKFAAAEILFETFQSTIYGQILDIASTNLDEQSVLQTLKLKTAIYTGVTPLLIGYSLNKILTKQNQQLITDFGLALGWAFQIQDDVLGMFGDPKVTGKAVGNDLREGKKTLLVLHLLKHGNLQQKQLLNNYLGNSKITEAQIKEIQQIMQELGSHDYAINLAKDYIVEGGLILKRLTNDTKLRDVLTSFLELMLERIS